MDYSHSLTATSAVAIIAFPLLFLFCFLWISRRNTNSKKTAPEAGGAWPIIGHLRLLGGSQPPHISLANMADKYGRIFSIKLGVHRALVVSDWEIAKACLTTNDKAFASRPKLASSELLGNNSAMLGFAPYGPYWRQIRKVATIELLSNHRLELLKHQLWNKKRSANSDKVLVEMKGWFKEVTLNVIMRMIVGKRIPNSSEGGENLKWRKSMDDFFVLSGKFLISDALPFLRFLDIGGDIKFMKKTAKELDQVVEGWLREHKQKRAENKANSEEDFMGLMLSILSDAEELHADTITKANSLAIIIAAADTTSVTLTWALSLLLNNRDTLSRFQQELDVKVGKGRLIVTESDTKNLVYLQSIIKETLRLYPTGPLSIIHEAIEDCTVNGYHVSAGTWLIMNLHKIHRDPLIWANPSKFQPERFMTTHKDVDVRGQNFELIPFGSGRRMCPGLSFALQNLSLILANVLHWFEFETSLDEAVDMREAPGLTSSKVTPLEVYVTPRLHAFVYNSFN
ncbi:hypothetical protein ES319_A06G016300v1 [Gossypium barbadense]|uniref:Cytochrome P450 n=2 Tax=Gossypium TaxID=3633 RepID=A0A5J5V8M6_GOSBA|nr:hypothetical protein ES319_A06G016300v1 [Gossypium barbadense]TYH11831.1 hypothetical protein ES288_A06G017200v1 [Gossypium darwinii]